VIRASDLIGCAVQSRSGERLGSVHDLRARLSGAGWELEGLLVGRRGMLARLRGSSGAEALVRGEVIPWHAVTSLEDGVITVRDRAN
jgi:sporulation protein YlmC with PRC-barrel domain